MERDTRSALKSSLIQIALGLFIGLGTWYSVINVELARMDERVKSVETNKVDHQKALEARLTKMEARIDQIYLVLTGGR